MDSYYGRWSRTALRFVQTNLRRDSLNNRPAQLDRTGSERLHWAYQLRAVTSVSIRGLARDGLVSQP